MMNMEKIEKEALKLPTNERASLAARLIRSLDEEEESDVEKSWIQEAERRYQEYRNGNVTGRPSEKVLKEIRSKFE